MTKQLDLFDQPTKRVLIESNRELLEEAWARIRENSFICIKTGWATGCMYSRYSRDGNGRGYPRLSVGGYAIKTHRVSYLWNKGPLRGRNTQVLHRCDDPRCFAPAHLFAGNNADNVADRDAKGRGRFNFAERPPIGERHGGRKLTHEQARHIGESECPTRLLAACYGIAYRTVQRIRRGDSWKHLSQVQAPLD